MPEDAGTALLTLTALVGGAPATADYGRVVDTLPFTFFDGARPPLITRISPQGVPLESHTQVPRSVLVHGPYLPYISPTSPPHLPHISATQVPRSVLVHGSNFAPDDLGCEIDPTPRPLDP